MLTSPLLSRLPQVSSFSPMANSQYLGYEPQPKNTVDKLKEEQLGRCMARGVASTMNIPQAEELNPDAATRQQPNPLPKPPVQPKNPKHSRRPSTRKGYGPKTPEISALLKASFENNDNPDNAGVERIVVATGMGASKSQEVFLRPKDTGPETPLLRAGATETDDEAQDSEMSNSTRRLLWRGQPLISFVI
ncbi:hypothetical protein ACEPPN_015695 [Leptodophora sp. 'Broadleaf-Isolate-01']